MKTLWRIVRWPFLTLAVAATAAVVVLAQNPEWIRVEAIEVELDEASTQHLLYQRIRSSLAPQIQKMQGRYLWQLSLKEVLELVQKDKRVKRVSIYRDFPSRVKVIVEPYTPVLSYLSRDGRIYPVANDATLLPALPYVDAPDLPFLRGEEFKDEPQLREAALELYNSIPEEGDLTRKEVSEIFYSKKEGFKIYLSGVESEVRLGEQDFGPKISRVSRVLNYLDSQNVKGRVIDARFSKKVVVRVRNTP